LPVEVLDRPLRVLADLSSSSVGPQAGVVVDRVVGEVRRDEFGVTGVQRPVVGADVVEVRQATGS
jgi:hypothetical protein